MLDTPAVTTAQATAASPTAPPVQPPQPPQRYIARFEDKTVHTDKFIQFSFELEEPHTMVFQSGQYVSLKVSERGDRRSYSMCSSPGISHGFEVLVDISPGGLGSKYLENLQFGAKVEVLAPMGIFTLAQNSVEQKLALIATGSGISPMRAIILDLLQEKQDSRDITLYWGLRYAQDLFWEDEFQQLSEAFPNFHFHPILSRAPEEWPLCRGRVTDCLSVHGFTPDTGFYLCGNKGMIQDVMSLLKERGIPDSQVHHEKFF